MSKEHLLKTLIWTILSLYLVLSIGYLGYDIFTSNRQNFIEYGRSELTEWEVLNADGSTYAITLPYHVKSDKGDTVTIRSRIPSDIEDDYLLNISNSSNLKLYIDNELRFEFDRNDGDIPGGIVKNVQQFVNISKADAGKSIVIERVNDVKNDLFRTIYYGDRLDLVATLLKQNTPLLVCDVVLIILSLAMIVFSFSYSLYTGKQAPYLKMALGVLIGALWIIFNSDIYQFLFNNIFIDGLFVYILILVLPIPLTLYVDSIQKGRYSLVIHSVAIMEMIFSLIICWLHFANIVSFRESFQYTGAYLLAAGVFVVVSGLVDIRKGHFKENIISFVMMFWFAGWGISTVILVLFFDGFASAYTLFMALIGMLVIGFIQQLGDFGHLEKGKREALASNMAKSEFLANMSHEIRTPINSVIGLNEMILRETNEPQIKSYAAQIKRSGKMLLSLVNDVLDISKIEAGKLEIVEKEYNTSTLIEDVVGVLQERASKKGLGTHISISPNIPSKMFGDELHIKDIYINLISNAVKYTKKGSVRIKVKAEPVSDNSGDMYNLTFAVSDTGIGIKTENIPLLFDSFQRVDLQQNHSIEGTGLGLSIVRKLLQAMKGTINVESEYGKGSCFTVVIPQKVVDAKPVGNVMDTVKKGVTADESDTQSFTAPDANVLVVDDNEVNLTVACALLKRTNVKVETAADGRECVYKCRKKKYDLILMDHRMPDPDGIETLHLLKGDSMGLNIDTNVVVLTANAYSGIREKYIQDGFNDYLSKPINPDELERTLITYLPKNLVKLTGVSNHDNQIVENDIVNEKKHSTEKNKLVAEVVNAPERKAVEMPDFDMSLGVIDRLRQIKEMDIQTTVDTYGDDEEFIKTLVSTMVVDGRIKSERMKKLLAEKNYKDFGIEAHAAKSSMATISAMSISGRAKALELAAKEQRLDEIDANAPEFIEDYLQFLDILDKALK